MSVPNMQKKGGLAGIFHHQLAGSVLALVVIFIISSLISEYFLSEYNMIIIVRSLAFIGVVSLGQAMLLVLGEIDLSVGTIAGLCGILGGVLMVQVGIHPTFAMALGLAFGMLCGLVNGLLVTKLQLNALVVTIGMSGVYKGLNLVITKGKAIIGIPQSFHFIGKGDLLGVPMPFVIMLLVLILVVLLVTYTPFGRYMYAIGNNREAAKIFGIKVDRVRIICFMIAGLFSALAGLLMVARIGSSQPAIGEIWVMTSIAAPVIGGVPTTGGVGHIAGAIIGAAIIGVIDNIIVLKGVSPYWQTVVSGGIVVLAIALDSISRRYLRKG
jgi:Ribose/xylose/arabinose/galactoside ABC-type transport systems, permease components